MRVPTLIAIAIAVSACGDDPAISREPVCIPADGDEALYAQLTANAWGGIQLHGSGGFRSTRTGSWNFRARDAASGIVCLDDGSVIDFAITPQGLQWGATLLPAANLLLPTGTRAGLPTVLPASSWYALTAHGWAKTNELDLHAFPTSLELARDGTLATTFASGCSVTGTFSLVVTDDGEELVARLADQRCGAGTGIGMAAERAVVTPDSLALYGATYRDAAAVTDEHSLAYSAFGADDGLRVAARWPGPIVAAAPAPWTFTLTNTGFRQQTVTSVRATLAPVIESGGTFMIAGPETTLFLRTLNVKVAPDASTTVTGELTFTGSGPMMLVIDASSSDSVQRYDNERRFILTL